MGDRSRRRGRSDRGVSLVEMLVVLAVTGVVATAVLSFLASFTERQRDQQVRVDTATAFTSADDRLATDVAGATSIGVQPANDYASRLPIVDTAGATVTWTVSAAGLTRTEVLGGVPSTRIVLEEAAAPGTAFRYFGPDGSELVPAVVGPDRLAYCTTRIRLQVRVPTDRGTDLLQRDVALARRDPGSLAC
jgi:prepilin-type N-terminal cleavage/methylation domain-containing protein